MDLRHLRFFVAIVEEGSFSEAARGKLNTAQSSLSRQIRELEEELGQILLKRGVKGVEPTAAGLIFFHHAQRILQHVQVAIDATRNVKHVLRVGCLPGLEQQLLAHLRSIRGVESAPVEFEVVGSSSLDLHQRVRDGHLDMALVWPDEVVSGLHSLTIFHAETVAIIPRCHPLADNFVVGIDQLRDEVCIAMDPKVTPAFWARVDAWCRRQDMELVPAHLAVNLTSALALVDYAGGFLLAPEYLEKLIPSNLIAMRLENTPPSVPVCLVYRPANVSTVGWIVEQFAERWNQVGSDIPNPIFQLE